MEHTKAIVVLTSGMRENDRVWKSGFDANLRLLAGVVEYKKSLALGEKPVIIISGGRTYGLSNPDLSTILAKKAYIKYHIPREDVILESESIDTTENAEFCSKILHRISLERNVEVVTNDFHLKRAIQCFRLYGVHPKGVNAEDVLYEKPKFRKMIDKWKGTPLHLASHIKEFAYRIGLYILGPEPFRKTIHNRIIKYGHR